MVSRVKALVPTERVHLAEVKELNGAYRAHRAAYHVKVVDVEVVESRDGAAVVGVAVALVRVLVEHGAEVDEEEGAVKRVENGEGS